MVIRRHLGAASIDIDTFVHLCLYTVAYVYTGLCDFIRRPVERLSCTVDRGRTALNNVLFPRSESYVYMQSTDFRYRGEPLALGFFAIEQYSMRHRNKNIGRDDIYVCVYIYIYIYIYI